MYSLIMRMWGRTVIDRTSPASPKFLDVPREYFHSIWSKRRPDKGNSSFLALSVLNDSTKRE
jgi:hypothetical protein